MKNFTIVLALSLLPLLTSCSRAEKAPVKSIKDIGDIINGPWKQEVVRLFGKKVTLDHVEHDTIGNSTSAEPSNMKSMPLKKIAAITLALASSALGQEPPTVTVFWFAWQAFYPQTTLGKP